MKKVYEAPAVEKVEFKYRDQVVATSTRCRVSGQYADYTDMDSCNSDNVTEERTFD